MCEVMLKHLGISHVRLMTNNPLKVAALQQHGIQVVERVPLMTGRNPHNDQYLDTKEEKMGHLF
jgi:GTP cyclohydrolase II